MINRLDAEEIARKTTDSFRTYVAHLRVDLSGDDLDKTLNFLKEMLSNYVDDKHILDTQYNPKTNRTEKIVGSGDAVMTKE